MDNESELHVIEDSTDEQLLAGTKLAFITARLKEYMVLMEQAQDIFDSLPNHIQNELHTCSVHVPTTLVQLPPKLRGDWIDFQKETLCLLETIRGTSRPWLSGEEEQIIISILRLFPKLQTRSRRQLRQFLESALEGDMGYLLIKNKGSKVEVRHRHRVSESLLEDFDISPE